MLLTPSWEENSSLCLPEAFQSLKGLYPTMIPITFRWKPGLWLGFTAQPEGALGSCSQVLPQEFKPFPKHPPALGCSQPEPLGLAMLTPQGCTMGDSQRPGGSWGAPALC